MSKKISALFNRFRQKEVFLAQPLQETAYSVTFFDSYDEASFKPGWSVDVATTDLRKLDIPAEAKRFCFWRTDKTTYSNYSSTTSSSRVGGAYVILDTLPKKKGEVEKIAEFLIGGRDYKSVTFIERSKTGLRYIDAEENAKRTAQKPPQP